MVIDSSFTKYQRTDSTSLLLTVQAMRTLFVVVFKYKSRQDARSTSRHPALALPLS
jgi:hypothetical protein